MSIFERLANKYNYLWQKLELTMKFLDKEINDHINQTFDDANIRQLSHQFRRDGFVKVPNIVSESLKSRIHEEIYQLLNNHAERRDLTLATTGHTPRKLSVVHSEMVSAHGHLIRSCSESDSFIKFLSKLAGEILLLDVKADEKFVITKQEFKGDTHGWHWGDYAFALIWLAEVPPLECGGMLQCIPHTSWDKSNPRINDYICQNNIQTHGFVKGDVYFLRADSTLHRTVPLGQDATRIMLNMTWACAADIGKNALEVDDRWWSDEQAEKVLATSA
jgi:L-lysine 4-chlorinase